MYVWGSCLHCTVGGLSSAAVSLWSPPPGLPDLSPLVSEASLSLLLSIPALLSSSFFPQGGLFPFGREFLLGVSDLS